MLAAVGSSNELVILDVGQDQTIQQRVSPVDIAGLLHAGKAFVQPRRANRDSFLGGSHGDERMGSRIDRSRLKLNYVGKKRISDTSGVERLMRTMAR